MPGFFESQVLRLLEPMSEGHLRVTLPGGSVREYGTPGRAPAATLEIRDPAFFRDIVLEGDIGFGDAFVRGSWDTDDLPTLIRWFIANLAHSPLISGGRRHLLGLNALRWINRLAHLGRANTEANSRRNIHEHYDLGNEFYALFLDPTMTYSSARFERPDQSLEEAQAAKYEALCSKLRLHPGDHVLEIGCGWGGFAEHAAKRHGCRVTGVTISERQHAYAVERIARAGLADRVSILLQDYRRITGRFTKIASIEMIEAVGERFLDAFFRRCDELLEPGGLLGVQVILCPDPRYPLLRRGVDWIQRRIFPGSLLPSVARLTEATRRGTQFTLHSLDDLGLSYARTLAEWRAAFHRQREAVRLQGFDERFLRKWDYYLSYCEAAFAMRSITVSQLLYTRPNNPALVESAA
jgi:cyclopropane-fatty-acyl-phospholipid synthase